MRLFEIRNNFPLSVAMPILKKATHSLTSKNRREKGFYSMMVVRVSNERPTFGVYEKNRMKLKFLFPECVVCFKVVVYFEKNRLSTEESGLKG